MAEVAIGAKGLGKRYRIGERVKYRALRGTLTDAVRAPFQVSRRRINTGNNFWALRNVSFEVGEGEIVGIIGPNGAGKSTLLKVLSRITDPTEGRARVRGRMGTLLEVGTGFHPELTGRENVYLNGAILGMHRREIDGKFDAIVDFAEVEQFVETPVKYYSSGMYVRLAFSVASHLEPEILLVDEVLAVGDAAFQKKCLGRMNDVAGRGRTVLVVSHNMGILRELTDRGIWLHKGEVRFDGDIREAISGYLASGETTNAASVHLENHPNRLGGMRPIMRRLCSRNADVAPATDFTQADEIVLELEYTAPDGCHLAGAGFILTTPEGTRVGGFNTYMAAPPPHHLPQAGKVTFRTAGGQLTPGSYYVTVSVGSHPGTLEDKVENALRFSVHPADIYGTGYLLTKEDGVAALSVTADVSRSGDQADA